MPSAMKKSKAPPVTSSAEKGKKKNKVCRYLDNDAQEIDKCYPYLYTGVKERQAYES